MSELPLLPYGRQTIEDDDIEAVIRVLRSDYLTTGPEVAAFEGELARVTGARHAIAVSNGTAALHCAYAAAGIGPGDEVITTPLTFSATANMVLGVGARPVFVDVDPHTLCIDPAKVEDAITSKTRAISAVDFAGHPAPMEALRELATRHRLALIEDAAHAIGSRLGGRPVGSLADLTTFSFHPVKTITTGEGGAVVTSDDGWAQRARDFRNHGLVRDRERLQRHDGPWYYEVQSLGFNYRLTDLQCALGRSQLAKLERFVARRAEIVARYQAALSNDPLLKLPVTTPAAQPAWHLYAVRVDGGAPARARLFEALRQDGILPQVHYVLCTEFPLYRELGYRPQDTPVAHAASNALLSLPLYPSLTDGDVDRVIKAVRRALASR